MSKLKDIFGNTLSVNDRVGATPPGYNFTVACKITAIDESGYIDLKYYWNDQTMYHTFTAMWDQVVKHVEET